MFIKLDDIIPNRFQPREVFEEEALNKLADSIQKHGVIEPILVRPASNKFEIIAGERRYKASVLAGLTKIPAIVKQMDDKESSIVAYIENEHRSNVSAIEEARTIDRILKSNNMKQEELAKELGINQSTLANKLRLLALPMEIQESLMHNEISERHARSLLTVKDENKQIELLRKIKEKRMTVRELDSEIKNMNNNYNENMGGQDFYMNNTESNSVPADNINNDQGFMSYLNNYDNNSPTNNQPESIQSADANFMNYLNSYDNNSPINESSSSSESGNDDFMSYLNNYDNNSPTNNQPEPIQPDDANFMNYLNSYDNNNPVIDNQDTSTFVNNELTSSEEDNPGFMNYLNSYDNNNPVNQPTEQLNDNFMNYLNSYDSSVTSDIPQSTTETSSYNDYLNNFASDTIQEANNGVMINDVTPPITSNFDNNLYVENNPNYVDISQNTMINSVDEVINKIKVVVDDIKMNSKYKIDTDEINYDDIYQITIKIDKRDF